ncbi:MAG: helix-turn-helix domain-containing protein [Chloroflexota bacterium]
MRKNFLRKLRRRLSYSQAELAEKAHCSRATIILVERLCHYPTRKVRNRLASALGVSESVIWPSLEASDDK